MAELFADINAGIAIDVSFDALHLLGELEAGAGISAEIQAEAEYLADLTASAGLQAVFGRNIETTRENETAIGLSADFECFNWSDFLRLYGDQAVIRYFFTLTGAPDGLADVTIPISSFQGRFRNAEPSYLSVVIPGLDYAADISDRANGEMVIKMALAMNGTLLISEEIVRVELENIDIYEGGTNKSIVLAGHKTETRYPKSVTMEGISYRHISNGKYRYRCSPNIYLRPGDTVVDSANAISFTADLISCWYSIGSATMEVAEQ